MRVRIITMGAQGDVRPGIAFGQALKAAGHDVRVISHPGFETLVRRRGLDFAPVAGDPRDLAKEDNLQLRGLHNGGRDLRQWWRTFKENDVPLMRQRLKDCWEACQDAEVIVASALPYIFGYAIATKLQIPLVRSFYFPVSPTRTQPIDFWPDWLPLPGTLNLATYHVQRQVIWSAVRPWIAPACRDVLGLSSLPYREPFGDLDRQRQLLLYAYSAAVAPPPPDWGSWIDVTGYWFLDRSAEWTPPPALKEFLDAGPPPVCIGFGSMTYDRAELIRTIEGALALTGRRAVLLAGWAGLRPPELAPNMITIDWAPLNWLFARMAAVVHHGGAGTTAESFRAGAPTIVVPFFYDQFLWGRRVFEIGAGPRPIPIKQLDSTTLANAIRTATTDPTMRQRASEVGARIRAEDGVGRAVRTFERHLHPTGGNRRAPVVDDSRPVSPGPALQGR